MKNRNGFVSNSSSSSFVIDKYFLSENQLKKIREHQSCGIEYAKTDPWNIEEDEANIYGYTPMDNFQFEELFEKMGLDENIVSWGS